MPTAGHSRWVVGGEARPEAASRLLSDHATLERFFELNPDAMVVTDLNGVVMVANRAASELFGYADLAMEGLEFGEIVDDGTDMVRTLANGSRVDDRQGDTGRYRIPATAVTARGTRIPINVSLNALRGPTGVVALNVILPACPEASADQVGLFADHVDSRWLLELQRDLLVEVARGHGPAGIADVLNRRFKRPVLIVDWALRQLGIEGDPGDVPTPAAWSADSTGDVTHGEIVHSGPWWTVCAMPDGDLLGWIGILDPAESLPHETVVALEQSVTVVTAELLQLQALAMVDIGTVSEFADFLLKGGEPCEVRSRARLLGYDDHGPHRVLAIEASSSDQTIADSVTRTARTHGVASPLVTMRSERAILIAPEELCLDGFVNALGEQLGRTVRIGIGGRHPFESIQRSYDEAVIAFELGVSLLQCRVTRFDELGVWKYLVDGAEVDHLQEIVSEWIGVLIHHDCEHGSELVTTLNVYLRESCAMEAAAATLYIHRNTLRYRLGKIAQIIGCDLTDPDQRFQLDLACRAWSVLQARSAMAPTANASTSG